MPHEESVTRYVITRIDKDGNRTLADHRQGRYTYETEAEAQKMLDLWGASMQEKLGYIGLEVRSCPCYPGHFDPQTCWFDVEQS